MKILITGCTDTHVNFQYRVSDVQFLSTPECLARMLRAAGHEVHHDIAPMPVIDTYDRVVCFVYPKGRHCRFEDNARQVLAARQDAIVGVDDWSATFVRDSWPDVCTRRVLAPMFNWGDRQLLEKRITGAEHGRLITIDPSCYITGDTPLDYGRRKRIWVNASYSAASHDWAASNTRWPIASFGCKDYFQPRILEAETFNIYQQAMGVLVPPYSISGTGWWRPRIIYAAMAGAVIGASRNEFSCMAQFPMPDIHVIERMYDGDISDLAAAQSNMLMKSIPCEEAEVNSLSLQLEVL